MATLVTAVRSAAGKARARWDGPASAARAFMLYVALPAWIGPGLLDWWCHRRTHIEEPGHGGPAESAVHSLMLAEGGAPVVLGMFFETNPLLVGLMAGVAVVHEATAAADVRLALSSDRHVSQFEQHVHSFLEVMPFWMIPLTVLLHWPMGRGWRLRRRSPNLSGRDLAVVGAVVAVAGALPYAEEMIRCIRGRTSAAGRPGSGGTDGPAGGYESPRHNGSVQAKARS